VSESPETVLQQIDDVLTSMPSIQEVAAYQDGYVTGFFPIFQTRRMVRLALRLGKP
jgi:hypothetical protein